MDCTRSDRFQRESPRVPASIAELDWPVGSPDPTRYLSQVRGTGGCLEGRG
jgi:hypothetical protein